jgi:hypothetical protein
MENEVYSPQSRTATVMAWQAAEKRNWWKEIVL